MGRLSLKCEYGSHEEFSAGRLKIEMQSQAHKAGLLRVDIEIPVTLIENESRVSKGKVETVKGVLWCRIQIIFLRIFRYW